MADRIQENGESEWLELTLGVTRSHSSSSSIATATLTSTSLVLGFAAGSPDNYYPETASPPPFLSAPGPVSRSPAGLWFTLYRIGDGIPQIPKRCIRVRDENVTVLMVQKYLVRKLGLSDETQIVISCMGEKLLHWQTLKHVRDFVWLPRVVESGDYRSVNYLMSLQYKRSFFN